MSRTLPLLPSWLRPPPKGIVGLTFSFALQGISPEATTIYLQYPLHTVVTSISKPKLELLDKSVESKLDNPSVPRWSLLEDSGRPSGKPQKVCRTPIEGIAYVVSSYANRKPNTFAYSSFLSMAFTGKEG
ncbi:hypothetical protein VNO77_23022 [Canavalia gladiata]|uniref:Uncharacterized protein n=1 Tax=Canavalia gladiata TaxID=3824 RepID=A0AAN9L479_CANGL